jgi:hypothetical protein
MAVTIPSKLIDQMLEGRVLFFVGAGCSMDEPSSLPSAWQLAQKSIKPRLTGTLAGRIEEIEIETGNKLGIEDIAQLFLESDGNLDRFNRLLPRQQWLGAVHHQGHEVLAELWAEGLIEDIVTTNMDALIEAGFKASTGIEPNVYTQSRHFQDRPAAPRVFKIHGCLRDEATMIWARSHLESDQWQHDWARVLMEHEVLRCSTIVYIGYATNLKYLSNILARANKKPAAFIVNPCDWQQLQAKAPEFMKITGLQPEEHIKAGAKAFLSELRERIIRDLTAQVMRSEVPQLLEKLGLSEESGVRTATHQVRATLTALPPDTLQNVVRKFLVQQPSTQKYASLRKNVDLHRLLRLLSIIQFVGVQVSVGGPESPPLAVHFSTGMKMPLWAIVVDGDTRGETERIKWQTRFYTDPKFREELGCGGKFRQVAVAFSGGTGQIGDSGFFDICRGTDTDSLRRRVPKLRWIVDQRVHSAINPEDVPATKAAISAYVQRELDN